MAGWRTSEVHRLVVTMGEHGRSVDEIAAEIRLLCRCSPLAAYRMAQGWSQPQAVEQYNRIVGVGYVDQPMLSRLERFPLPANMRAPQASQLIGWASLYKTTPLRLITPEAMERLDSHERTVLLTFARTFDRSNADHTQEQVLSTNPISHGFNGTTEGRIALASRRALRFSASVEGTNVGPDTLDSLRDEVSRLARLYVTRPLAELLPDLVDTQDIAFRLLEGRQRPSEAVDLYLVAGAVCAILAEASHHVGDIPAAKMQARATLICADSAGHDGLRARAYGLRSLIAYWSGWPHDAIRYGRLGASLPASGTSAAWLPALEARAHAALGDGESTRNALQRAEAAREQLRSDDLDVFGGILTFTRMRQMYYSADTASWSPGTSAERLAAEVRAIEAINVCEQSGPEERSFATEAGSRAVLALARINLGDLDGAQEALSPVLDLDPARRVRGVLGTLERIKAALRVVDPPRYGQSSASRKMQEEIEAYCQAPAALALPRG